MFQFSVLVEALSNLIEDVLAHCRVIRWLLKFPSYPNYSMNIYGKGPDDLSFAMFR